jgi:hypothetical protein
MEEFNITRLTNVSARAGHDTSSPNFVKIARVKIYIFVKTNMRNFLPVVLATTNV